MELKPVMASVRFTLGVSEDPFFDILFDKKNVDIRCWKNPNTPIAHIYDFWKKTKKPFAVDFVFPEIKARTPKIVVRATFYGSIPDALEAEGISNVLGDRATTMEEAMKIYRTYYTEKDEINGVIAIKLI